MMSRDTCGKGCIYEEARLESKIGIHFWWFPIFVETCLIPKIDEKRGNPSGPRNVSEKDP